MREKKDEKQVPELADGLRRIIRQEVEAGLAGFRAKDFETALRAKLRSGREAAPRRAAFFKLATAVGLALAAVAIGAVILWLAKAPPSPAWPSDLALSLEASPGLINLQEYPLPVPPAEAGQPSPGAALVGRALSSASAEAAAAAPGPGTEGALKPLRRISLEKKMELLYGDRTIERALQAFGDKFKEV